MVQTDVARLRRAPFAIVGAAALLLLASCSSASPSAAGSVGGVAARCEVTDGASAAQTVTIQGFSFGDEVTIAAGEAVAFTNQDGTAHTITEGTEGRAAADACADASIANGATVTVTFNEAGDYDITCKVHPAMQTVIHVQ